MSTSRPISTITYNTIPFLINKLNSLIYLDKITYYEFIEHIGDTDDKKNHIHLYIEPACSLNLSSFQKLFLEKDSTNNIPLQPRPFRNSKYGDWYWYVLHNKKYLQSKQLERNISYNDSDIYSSNPAYHLQIVQENPLDTFCKFSDTYITNLVINAVNNGISFSTLAITGQIPLNKINLARTLYLSLELDSSVSKKSERELISNLEKCDISYASVQDSIFLDDDLH